MLSFVPAIWDHSRSLAVSVFFVLFYYRLMIDTRQWLFYFFFGFFVNLFRIFEWSVTIFNFLVQVSHFCLFRLRSAGQWRLPKWWCVFFFCFVFFFFFSSERFLNLFRRVFSVVRSCCGKIGSTDLHIFLKTQHILFCFSFFFWLFCSFCVWL